MVDDLSKLKVAELKARLKAAGCAGTGEKPDLVARLKQVGQGESLKIDGCNPAALKAGVLKKELSTRGLPCSLDLETRDVLVGRLIDALRKERGSSEASGGGDGGGGGGGASSEDDAIALAVDMARQVLELAGDAASILSLVGASISAASPFAQQRKAYLALSRMIHPDKLSRHFDGATRAFQVATASRAPLVRVACAGLPVRGCLCGLSVSIAGVHLLTAETRAGASRSRVASGSLRLLAMGEPLPQSSTTRHSTADRACSVPSLCMQELVRAFDELTAPPEAAGGAKAGGGKKATAGPALSRSNDNCYRTRVFCPRCDAECAPLQSRQHRPCPPMRSHYFLRPSMTFHHLRRLLP